VERKSAAYMEWTAANNNDMCFMKKILTTLFIAAGLTLIVCTEKADAQSFTGFCSACIALVYDPYNYQVNSATAASVTTGGGGGDYQSNAAYISSLDQTLFSGVNSQNFGNEFPGWQALPANSTNAIAIPLVATVLHTYGQALALAQSQEQELEGEDFSNISTVSSNTTALLTATQANTQAVLANVQEQQYTRQLLAALLTVETTKAAEELNERAQEAATSALSFNFGEVP
jgi:hypothetical protein